MKKYDENVLKKMIVKKWNDTGHIRSAIKSICLDPIGIELVGIGLYRLIKNQNINYLIGIPESGIPPLISTLMVGFNDKWYYKAAYINTKGSSIIGIDNTGANAVIVDDVIYTGNTLARTVGILKGIVKIRKAIFIYDDGLGLNNNVNVEIKSLFNKDSF